MSEEFRDKIATVDADGDRIWVHPKKVQGRFMDRRKIVAYALLAVLFAGPWLTIGGEPVLLMNILERKFVIFGQVFWPQDTFLFALAMLTFFFLIIVFTVVFGRLFCGWVCPQTVFLEFIFRPIEHWIEGDRNARVKLDKGPWTKEKVVKKLAKWAIYYLISLLIAHTFLAYVIGKDALLAIQTSPPSENLPLLFGLLVFSLVFFWVFARLREQVCTTICPYGRLQGVLVDNDTINVTYDHVRGEPRGHRKKGMDQAALGDCVDCNLCVQVCPTGIDIRNGLQLECVHCTACIDACDGVMDKIGSPRGLIRYASENSIRKATPFHWTNRAKAYMVVLGVLVVTLTGLIFFRSTVEFNVYRASGMLYNVDDEGNVSNLYHFTLVNKTHDTLHVDLRPNAERFDLNVVNASESQTILVEPESIAEGVFFLKTPPGGGLERKNKIKLNCVSGERHLASATTEFPAPPQKD